MPKTLGLLSAALGFLLLAPPNASARWSREFEARPVFSTEILSATSFEGRLIVGGYFGSVNGTRARNVAAWDGIRWEEMGNGLGDGVFDFTLLGHELVAAGSFHHANRTPRMVARWDGMEWQGFGDGPSGVVTSVTTHEGRLLAACKTFASSTSSGTVEEWNGTAWSPIGEVLDGSPTSVLSRDGRLFIAGYFEEGVLEWDGWSWIRVGDLSGWWLDLVDTPAGLVATTGRHRDENSGPGFGVALLKGEHWVPLRGTSWSPKEVMASTLFGDQVVVAGRESIGGDPGVFTWDGTDWRELGSLPMPAVYALCVHEGELVACGTVDEGGHHRNTILAWDGSTWKWPPGGAAPLEPGGPAGPVCVLLTDGDELLVGGAFDQVAQLRSGCVAAWTGEGWRAFPGYLAGPRGDTECSILANADALLSWRDELYCGGRLMDHSAPRRRHFVVARWSGTMWECVGGPAEHRDVGSNTAHALTVWNDALIAAGEFEVLSGLPCPGVAELDGAAWSPLGDATSLMDRLPIGPGTPTVHALCVFQDQLFCGGRFVTGAEGLGGVAVWTGLGWEPLAGGVDGLVEILQVDGDWLLVGGRFTRAGLTITRNIAAWDGVRWTELGEGLEGKVTALTLHEGQVVAAIALLRDGVTTRYALRLWDGEMWRPFPSDETFDGQIRALASFRGDLYVGGDFGHVGDQPSPFLARWISD